MLYRTNFMALVGGGDKPKWPKSHLNIWDDHQKKVIADLRYPSDVLAVRCRQDKISIALVNKVYVYNFADLALIDCLETCDNPDGMSALNPESDTAVLAIPDQENSRVKLQVYTRERRDGL